MRDYMIRRDQAAERRGDVLCECGHANREHHELPRQFMDLDASIAAGQIIEHPNPEYRPLHFHCDHDDCTCVLIRD